LPRLSSLEKDLTMSLRTRFDNLSESELRLLAHETDFTLYKIVGAEDFTARYKKYPEIFDKFIKYERKLKRNIKDFFDHLSKELPFYVKHTLTAQEEDEEDENTYLYTYNWDKEEQSLGIKLYDSLWPIVLLGLASLAKENKYPYHPPVDSSKIIRDLQKYSSKLSSDLTDTTKSMIIEQVKASIKLGETSTDLLKRLSTMVDSEARAEMIARSESVRMYAQGRYNMAQQLDLPYKIWETAPGACIICSPLNGVTVKRDDEFADGIFDAGDPHPNCRCSVHYVNDAG